jgi:GTPase SAR1 family protein
MKGTQFQEVKQATRNFRTQALSALEEGGAAFAQFKVAIDEHVLVDQTALTIAMAGEYSVGKSSLIRALTAEDIPVGAGVTTVAVGKYKYGEDLVLVDMPGTLSGQMEHDEIAKAAMTDAHLILFVVSNELFNSESLPYFKLAAEQLAKKYQMLLVVNKFDRFNLAGRTPEQAVQFIAGILAEQIRPLEISEFGPVVVSARDYLAALETVDNQRRRRRHSSSRFDALISSIDEFTAKRGLLAQQVRPLQQLLEILEEAFTLTLADDGSRARAKALVSRRIFAITEARSLARTELRNLRDLARGRFIHPREKILKLIDARVSQEEMDAAASEVEADLEIVVKDVGDELKGLQEKLVIDLQDRLHEIDGSPLAHQVNAEFDAGFDRPDVSGLSGGMSSQTRKAMTEGLRKGSDYLAKNTKQVADTLGRVYKFFGGKFRPWGKVKLGSWVGKAGRVLGPLIVIGEAYLNYREEEQKEKAERQLRTLRAELRAQFADAASQFDAALREHEDQLLRVLYEEPLVSTQQLVREIVAGEDGKRNLAEQISKLTQDIREWIDKLAE